MNSPVIITTQFAIKLLEKALKIYTPSLSEKPMAEFLAGKCDEFGFDKIKIDDVGNVIAKKGSGSPSILLCGHMDTVPGKIKVKKDNGYMYGRGSSDAKAPLIAMLVAAASIHEDLGTIIFVGVVDEEGNATGIKNIIKQDIYADYAIFGEPSGLKQITISYKGRLAIKLRINVKNSAHASAPWLSKNAIEEAIILSKELKKILETDNTNEKKSRIVTVTITEIKGGISHNVIPNECDITIDIRIPINMGCKEIAEKISDTINNISKKREIEVLYSILDETEPFETSHNSMLIRAFTLGIIDIVKERPMLIRKTGTGDMNIIGNQIKIPMVSYGPGDPHESHTTNERISIREYLNGIEVYKKTLQHLKRLHNKKRK